MHCLLGKPTKDTACLYLILRTPKHLREHHHLLTMLLPNALELIQEHLGNEQGTIPLQTLVVSMRLCQNLRHHKEHPLAETLPVGVLSGLLEPDQSVSLTGQGSTSKSVSRI